MSAYLLLSADESYDRRGKFMPFPDYDQAERLAILFQRRSTTPAHLQRRSWDIRPQGNTRLSEFVSGKRKYRPKDNRQAHTLSCAFIMGLRPLISKMPIRLFNVCLEVKGAKSGIRTSSLGIEYWNRIERTLLAQEGREIPLRKRLLALLPGDDRRGGQGQTEGLACWTTIPKPSSLWTKGRKQREITRVQSEK